MDPAAEADQAAAAAETRTVTAGGVIVTRTAEPFDEQCATRDVVPQQPHTALAIREAEGGDLVPGGITRPRDDHLHHGSRAVVEGGFRDQRLGRIGEGMTDDDRPVLLEARDEGRKLVEPRRGADGERLVAHDGRDVDHIGTFAIIGGGLAVPDL